MNRTEARLEAQRLVGPDLAAQVGAEDWEAALSASLVPDADGHLPGTDGYVDSFDPQWAAAEALTVVAVRAIGAGGGIVKFTAEGASFETAAPDLWAAIRLLRARSVIGKANTAALGMIEVEGRLSGYTPTSGRRSGDISVLPNGAIVPSDLDWS